MVLIVSRNVNNTELPATKGFTIVHCRPWKQINCNRCICPGCYTSIILVNNLVNRNRSFSVHAGKCRLFNRYLKLIKVDHKISCDYRFLSKFDFYPQRIWETRLRKKNKACLCLSFFGCDFRFTWYILMQNAPISYFRNMKRVEVCMHNKCMGWYYSDLEANKWYTNSIMHE